MQSRKHEKLSSKARMLGSFKASNRSISLSSKAFWLPGLIASQPFGAFVINDFTYVKQIQAHS